MSVLRIIDANANRAREALRVMEEAARFMLNDEELSAALKQLRHDLAEVLSKLGDVHFHRDTTGDVGTRTSTETELTRASSADVVIAAGKRLSEALRAIEEYGKTLDRDIPAAVEKLRYVGYDLEQRLNRVLRTGVVRQWRLCVLLSESVCAHPWEDVLKAVVESGADCIQVREKEMDGGALADRVARTIELARPAGASVIVNDRADVALATGADGVHVGQNDLSIKDVRKIAGRRLLIGASTHDLDEAASAVNGGADYCGVGPMFPSELKPKLATAGPNHLRHFVELYPDTPHLAIGGVTPRNAGELVDAGARGVAVSTAVCAADDPAAAGKSLLDLFRCTGLEH